MNLKLKQRVVGIVIMLAFVAIAIPFLLFSGSKAQNKQKINSNISANYETTNSETAGQQKTSGLTPEIQKTAPQSSSNSQEPAQNALTIVKTIEIPHLQNNIPKFAIPVPSNNNNDNNNSAQQQSQVTEQETETPPDNPNMQITPIPPAAPITHPHNANQLITVKKNHTPHKNLVLTTYLPHKKNHIANNAQLNHPIKIVAIHKTHNKLSAQKTKKYAENIKYIKYNNHKNSIIIKHQIKKISNKKNTNLTQHNLNTHTKQQWQWLVHTGTYHNKARAQYLLKKLKTSHYQAFIQRNIVKNNKVMHRVVVGPIPNQKNAEKLAKKIAKNFRIKTKTIIYPQRTHIFKTQTL